MTKIETVTIHHLGILAESEVPPESVHSWLQQGWLEGPFPRSDNRPPKKGRGSDKAAWVAHAQQLGVDITDAVTRDEIIAAVETFDTTPHQQIASRQPDDDDSLGETTKTPKEGQS